MIGRMTHGSAEALRDLAQRHLPAETAERWLGLLRPGVRLTVAGAADPVVGRLGGLPGLPADTGWPVWEGHGPLSFVASIDCAALPPGALDIDLPGEGTLLFFYFDGQLDGGEALVLAEDPDSRPGARVLHVPAAAAPAAERAAPEGITAYPAVPLTARAGLTAAELWQPAVQPEPAPDSPVEERHDHPVDAQEFLDALWDFDGEPGHRIGGHPSAVQNPVELEVAHAALDGAADWDDPRLAEEAGRWVLLAQFDSEDAADMMWGDCGALYWLIRPRDLAERRFDRAVFTWQCG